MVDKCMKNIVHYIHAMDERWEWKYRILFCICVILEGIKFDRIYDGSVAVELIIIVAAALGTIYTISKLKFSKELWKYSFIVIILILMCLRIFIIL